VSEDGWLLLLVVFLLLASGFFVAAEFALISARRTVVEPLAISSRRARSTLRAMEDVSVMMATAQLGITLCGVLLGALGEPAIAHLLEPMFHALGVPEAALHAVSLVVALLLVVSAHVALGEMVPKNIALAAPERTAMTLAPPMRALVTAIGPLVRGLNRVANWTVRLLGFHPKDEVASSFSREEVAGLVAESRDEGLLDPEDHQLITSALQFDAETLTSVLVPDADVVTVPEAASAAAVERACAHSGFSRFPVLAADGHYLGYLHIRDVVDIPVTSRDAPVPADRIRRLPDLPATTGLRTALDRMRGAGAHVGQVSDAAGRRLGLVMLEDVIESLIGEVRDATRRHP
jgi:CBS domain containing-hemolysin-like protein